MSTATLALRPQDCQPNNHTLVWQHNSLAEARYNLTAREQKVLLYVISMVEAEDDDLKLYKIRVEDFARLLHLEKDDLYQELREAVVQLKSKPLVVRNHFEPGDKKPKNLLTSWFQDVVTEADGTGYIGVSISSRLKPYLLQVKQEFFRYQLGYAIELRSTYALRLYQWAKRWQFARKRLIDVDELRTVMGAEELDKEGEVKRQTLPRYANFHQTAIRPAVKEINKATDLRLSYEEKKRPGTKQVEALLFTIAPSRHSSDLLAPFPGASEKVSGHQGEFFDGDEKRERYLYEVKARFGLSALQVKSVRAVVHSKGIPYLQQKVEVVTQQGADNAARALLAALRDDWQPRVTLKKKAKPKVAPALPEQPPTKVDFEPMARLWAEASESQRMAWLKDNLLREMAPKDGERPRPVFLARLHSLTQPAEAGTK
jgi:plasmid replication initiation protein